MSKSSLSSFGPLLALSVGILGGCSGDGATASGVGGSPAAGGVPAGTGGSPVASGGQFQASGGSTFGQVGATTTLGGTVGSGGTTTGIVSSGGTVASNGGAAASGGSPAVGGTSAKGGMSAVGGSSAKGGTSAVGGTTAKGGSSAVGGTTAKGGSSAVGGTTAKGGSSAVGGTTAKGGSTAAGGTTSNGTTPVTIWLAGDSTVQTCSSACPCGWGSPTAFGSYFNSNVTINNQAISGRSIQTWMYEPNVTSTIGTDGECVVTETNSTRWTTVLNGMKSGDYFFIQFGINDGDSACPRHVGSARYKTLLKRLGQAALDKGAHPIFVTPTGMIKCSSSTAVASRGFITETKAAGTELGVPVIDLHALSTALYNTLAFCPLPAGNTDISATTGGAVGAFFCTDHTHFDASGALSIAGAVAKALTTQGIALSAYLK